MKSTLAKAFDVKTFRQNGIDLIHKLADYLDKANNGNLDKTIPYASPADSLTYWQNRPMKSENFMGLVQDVLDRSTKLHNPKYMGHQVVPPVPLAALAGFFTEFLNNGMAVYEMGMAFNPIEKLVCDMLCQKTGYPDSSGGILTSGGTLGNLTALLTARAKICNLDVWTAGDKDTQLAIMVSEEAHYCVDRAARIMGLGEAGIIKVPVNDDYTMNTELLQNYYEQATKQGKKVFAIIGSAASTSTGSHDDLQKIAAFASKNDIWLHVDAAHGGGAVFSEKYKHQLKGIDLADSVVIDLHKMLLTPALATAVLYKQGSDCTATFHQKAQYLWDNSEGDWFNSGKRTFECTKLGICFKFYALWHAYGEKIFEENVDTLYDLAKTFALKIKSSGFLDLAVEPSCNIVNFRPQNLSNEQVLQIREALILDGEFYIVSTILKGQVYLRTSLMNTFTSPSDLDNLLSKIKNLLP